MNWLSNLPAVPELLPPVDEASWRARRDEIRSTLWNLLGDLPPRAPAASRNIHIIATEQTTDYTCEKFSIENGAGVDIPGYLLIPRKTESTEKRFPAILYCHWHGDEYPIGKEEIFQSAHTPEAPGPALSRKGYAVMAIDAHCFGERSGKGPGGPSERGAAEEMSAAKFNLWAGRSLWGMILHDDLIAFDYLASRPEVDPSRIGVMGISMGATRTWWLMALEERLRAGVAAACLTRYQDLIANRALDKHGIYYYAPGVLKYFDTEAIVASIAPRPLLLLTGDRDAGSPIEGVRKIEAAARPFWKLYAAEENLSSIVYPGLGHEFTPDMWMRTLDWFDRNLI